MELSLTPVAWRRFGFAVILAQIVVLYAPTVVWLFDRWTMSVWHHAHGLFIPPVVAYYVWLELRDHRDLPPSSSAWGFAILAPALLVHVLDTGMHTQLLSAASLVLALPGLSLLFLGVHRTRAIAFPLAFAAFALPIPLTFTEQIHLLLRQITTAVSAAIVPMLGIPVFVEGTTLHLAAGALEIADACSGFSTVYAALAVACLTAYGSADGRRRWLVLLAAVPLAMMANVARVLLLVVLVVSQGLSVLETPVHPLSGMLTFALALPAILWLGTSRSSRTNHQRV